jgi:hypothetical protein
MILVKPFGILVEARGVGVARKRAYRRDRKGKPFNHKGHEGTQRKTFEVYANLGWPGMKWDEPGGGRGTTAIA